MRAAILIVALVGGLVLFRLGYYVAGRMLERDPTQFKLVPLLASNCPHEDPPDEEQRCPVCRMLFVRVVYADWVQIGKPRFLFRSISVGFHGVLDRDTRIVVHEGEAIEIVPSRRAIEDVQAKDPHQGELDERPYRLETRPDHSDLSRIPYPPNEDDSGTGGGR